MGQTFDKTCDQMNNGRWHNPSAFGDQVDHCNPQMTSSWKDKPTGEHCSWYSSDDPTAKIEPPSCRQYTPDNFLAVRPLYCDEIFNEDDGDENCTVLGAPSGGRCRTDDRNDNDADQGEGHTQGGEKGMGNRKGARNGKRKWKATEDGKGKRKPREEWKGNGNRNRNGNGNRNRNGNRNGNGKCIVEQTLRGETWQRGGNATGCKGNGTRTANCSWYF